MIILQYWSVIEIIVIVGIFALIILLGCPFEQKNVGQIRGLSRIRLVGVLDIFFYMFCVSLGLQ